MAWRPYEELKKGMLDNTALGKVTGWMEFAGLQGTMIFNLKGDFHRDIRGTQIILYGNGELKSEKAMEGISLVQKGDVGDITAGREPADYVDYPYIEWYSEANGRVVLELEPEQIEVVGQRIPPQESYPVDREQQAQNMFGFMSKLSKELGHKENGNDL